ncbi:MAG: tetratricopeptide repeat protein [Planctomycetes bacterium]|nr:tetratricopeptide repeat protein [Planctomycetota bacterium]
MQMRFFLVPLLAALPCSCKSTGSHDEASREDSSAMLELSGATDEKDEDGMNVAIEVREASAPAAAIEPAQGDVSADAALLAVKQQRAAFLASESVRQGDRLKDQGDLDGALREYSNALEVDPSNQEARRGLTTIRALMGDRFADAAANFEDLTGRAIVQRAQARMAAEDAAAKGDLAFKQGDLDAAVGHYRQAELILRYNPLIATESLDERIVSGKLAMAAEKQEENAQAQERAARDAAEDARKKRELEEKNYRENKLRTLYSQANQAFLVEKYTLAESLCRQILVEDPGNEAAKKLQQIARDARHQKAEEDNRTNYREQWIRTFEELETINVLQNDTLVFNDMKRWAEVDQRKPYEFGTVEPVAAGDKAIILEKLDQTRCQARFAGPDGNGSALADIANYLQQASGVNFVISSKVATELDDEQRTISLDVASDRSVRKVLELIAEVSENIRWKVEDGVVKFVHKDELKGGQILRFYEVRDLIHAPQDFAAREMNVSPSGGVQLPEEEKVEREANIITTEGLDQLIRNNIGVGSWDADPQNSIKITDQGTMVVHQTPEVQEQIQHLLDDLREATGIMVDISARFLKVEDNFLEDIGVDFRGLGQPGLGTNESFNDFGDPSTQADLGREIGQGTDLGAFYNRGFPGDMRARVEELYDVGLGDSNVIQGSGGASFTWTYLNDLQLQLVLRAVSKSERVELVTSPRITVYNTARGNLSVLNQVAYVQDFNVEIAQAASIADPIVNVVQDGVILDVRPVVSADRRFITLELRPTIAVLKRPMREVVTTLGSQNSVTIQLPEVDYQRVRTSIPMPDGGTVLLGGMKISDRQDLRSGVPILNKIPLVSFFFDRKGNYISNRKLLILLKANIVIPVEHEPSEAQTSPPSKASRL